MVNTVVFYQVAHELKRVVSELEIWQSEHGDDLSSDIAQVGGMITHVEGLIARYKTRHPNVIDPEVVKSVYANVHALQAEIEASIWDSIPGDTDDDTLDNIVNAIDRLHYISNWHELDGTELSLRTDAIFAPLLHDDPSERGEFYRAQDAYMAFLDSLMLSLHDRLSDIQAKRARQQSA
jgi:hypothetical protein